MQEKFMNSGFARLYLWATKAKYTMGIFYIAFVFFYLLLGFISKGPAATLDFFTAFQMIFVCFAIGLLQQAILPAGKLSRTRCIAWMASGTAVTLLSGLLFRWFAQFPLWCAIVFPIVVLLGMGAIIVGYYIELHRETKALNHQLKQYQESCAGEGT